MAFNNPLLYIFVIQGGKNQFEVLIKIIQQELKAWTDQKNSHITLDSIQFNIRQ